MCLLLLTLIKSLLQKLCLLSQYSNLRSVNMQDPGLTPFPPSFAFR